MKPGTSKKNNIRGIGEADDVSRQREMPSIIDDGEHQIQEDDNSSENMDSAKKKNEVSDESECDLSGQEESGGEEESEGLTQQKEKRGQLEDSDLKDD